MIRGRTWTQLVLEPGAPPATASDGRSTIISVYLLEIANLHSQYAPLFRNYAKSTTAADHKPVSSSSGEASTIKKLEAQLKHKEKELAEQKQARERDQQRYGRGNGWKSQAPPAVAAQQYRDFKGSGKGKKGGRGKGYYGYYQPGWQQPSASATRAEDGATQQE